MQRSGVPVLHILTVSHRAGWRELSRGKRGDEEMQSGFNAASTKSALFRLRYGGIWCVRQASAVPLRSDAGWEYTCGVDWTADAQPEWRIV
jgi:hypothetical protein